MSEERGVSYANVKWRNGGLYQVLQPLWTSKYDRNGNELTWKERQREVTWGNNIATFGDTDSDTFGHEFGHIIQVQTQGWANFQARGIFEQIIFGNSSYYTRGFNEFGAETMLQNVGGNTLGTYINTDPYGN